MELTMLGTGNAVVTECYNTCFIIEDNQKYFMVDGGGGGAILTQLKNANLRWQDMREIFVTHKHIDHLLGIIWMIRMICQNKSRGLYEGEANIYGHEEVILLLEKMSRDLFSQKEMRFIGKTLHFIIVNDGEERIINGNKVCFFDIHSTKAKQYGFKMELSNGKSLVCCGDEPCSEACYSYAENANWLLHEAFCLYSDADVFHPYQKHHSTVKDACELAQRLNIENLILYHTEDKNIQNRKKLYLAEGREYYKGNLYIPDDLEKISLL